MFDVCMKNFSTMRVGGIADLMIFPENVIQIKKIVNFEIIINFN